MPGALACFPEVLAAQRTATILDGPTCVSGRPLPRCRRVWLTEFTYGRRLNSSRKIYPLMWPDYLSFEVGGLENYTPRWAAGGTLFASIGGGTRWGIRVRGRRWLGASGTALDLGVGAVLAGTEGGERVRQPGVVLDMSVSRLDRIGVVLRTEFVRDRAGRTYNRGWVGWRMGGEPGIGMAVLYGALFCIAVFGATT